MLTKTMFQTVCIMVLFSILHCNADTCSCTCCAGNSCTPTLQGTILVPSCASPSCKSLCQHNYPSQCINGSGQTSYQCTGGRSSTPIWPGVYSLANRCDTRTCCCPVGDMVLTATGANKMRVQCQLSGQCPTGSSSYDSTIDTPYSFSILIDFLGYAVNVELSGDSRTISLTNVGGDVCSEKGTKSEGLSTTTINLVFLLISSGLMTIRQFMI